MGFFFSILHFPMQNAGGGGGVGDYILSVTASVTISLGNSLRESFFL